MTATRPTSRAVEIDLDQIRVVETENAKGDPIIYLETLGVPVFYSTPDKLRDMYGTRFTEDASKIADFFRDLLRKALVGLLVPQLDKVGEPETASESHAWSSQPPPPTLPDDHDRVVRHVPPLSRVGPAGR